MLYSVLDRGWLPPGSRRILFASPFAEPVRITGREMAHGQEMAQVHEGSQTPMQTLFYKCSIQYK